MSQIEKYKKFVLAPHMQSTNILGLVLISLLGVRAYDPFYTTDTLKVEVSQHSKDLAAKPNAQNPIILDAHKNGLYPNKILTTFSSPHLTGTTPPGVNAFMASQVFFTGDQEDKYKYPLFIRHAIEEFDGSNKNHMVIDCNKEGGKCPEGYAKVKTQECKNGKNSIECNDRKIESLAGGEEELKTTTTATVISPADTTEQTAS